MSAVNCGCDPEENDYKCERHRKMSMSELLATGWEQAIRAEVAMTLNEYQQALHTYKDRHHECHALGLVGEVAEVINELTQAVEPLTRESNAVACNLRPDQLTELVRATIAAGNVADMVKKATAHGVALDPEKLKKELGDVLWYITAVASDNKLTMDDIAKANIAKLQARYPAGFVKGGGVRDVVPHGVVRQEPFLSDVADGKYGHASVNLRTEAEPVLPDTTVRPAHCIAFACGCRETTETDGTRQRTYCSDGNCRRLAR